MDVSTKFETYIQLDDDTEYNVEVECSGNIIENGFTHEFGYESKYELEEVFIDSLFDLDNEIGISIGIIPKKELRKLKNLAYDYLIEEYSKYDSGGYYD